MTSKTSFDFGTPATSAGSRSVFGSTTSTGPTGSSFPPLSSGGGLFGSSSNTSGQAGSLFGAQSTTSAPTTSPFGAVPASNSGPRGGDAKTQKPSFFGAGNSTGSGLFSTPKPSETKPGATSTFGAQGGITSGITQQSFTTPAAVKSAVSMLSTTPAGLPPAGPPSTSTFTAPQLQEQNGGLFGGIPSTQAATTSAVNGTSSLFGASQSTATMGSKAPNQSTTNLFGQTTAGGGSQFSPASTQQGALPEPIPFAKLGGASMRESSISSVPVPALGNSQKPLATANATSSTFNFPPSTTTASSNTSNVLPTSSILQDTKSSSIPTFASSIFGVAKSEPGPSFGALSSTAPAASSASGMASTALKPMAGGSNTNGKTSAAKSSDPSSKDDSSKLAGLPSATTGPRPTAQSRLKNKSMDEIITRWASDLSKYQKEFQKQALRVTGWDRSIVDNAAKIQKLYADTLEAERATSEVERQLSLVENDQEELENWLSHYEKQVDDMIATQVGQGDSLQGPDQERERTFKLAEKLSDRLEEMGKDLTSMVEEINDASSNLSKSSGEDDPLSQIVRILNGHLTQLQQIDQGTAAVQNKLVAAQKASRGMTVANTSNAIGSDPADDFYRSYMGRR